MTSVSAGLVRASALHTSSGPEEHHGRDHHDAQGGGQEGDRQEGDRQEGCGQEGKQGSRRQGRRQQEEGEASGSEVAAELGKPSAVKRQTKAPTTGASYLTRDHDVIKKWAGGRGGTPADVRGTRKGKGAGVLRIEFQDPADRLADIDWTEFFATFDSSDVDFLYQEHTADGSLSRFNKFVREA